MKRIILLLVAIAMMVIPVSAFNYTIGSTGYDFGQQFTVTANTGTGAVTGYQIDRKSVV